MYFVLEFIVQFNEFLKMIIIAYISRRFFRLHSAFAETNFNKRTKKLNMYKFI